MSHPERLDRRRFLAGATGAAIAVATGTLLPAQHAFASVTAALPEISASFWLHPRTLHLYRTRTKEYQALCYWRDGALQRDGYAMACHMLRDVRAGQAVAMQPLLLDLLCATQAWIKAVWRTDQPLHITSGYRSPETNAKTEGAARNSLHTRGMAADIRQPGVSVSELGRLAAAFVSGGVGFYPDRAGNFVHVDVGRVRYWQG